MPLNRTLAVIAPFGVLAGALLVWSLFQGSGGGVVAAVKELRGNLLRDGGVLFIAASFAVAHGLPRAWRDQALRFPFESAARVLGASLLALGGAYLAYPNFIDHVESTMASLGSVASRGGDLYPWPDAWPWHGILYGPLIAEVGALLQSLGLSPLVASKLPALACLAASMTLGWRLLGPSHRGWLLLWLPFGNLLFWTRPEPYLLLASVAVLALARPEGKARGLRTALLVGLVAGVASSLKLHGAAYALAAWIACTWPRLPSWQALAGFGAAALASFLAFFLPGPASLEGFLAYLRLAGGHPFSFSLALRCFLLLGLYLLPLFPALRAREGKAAVAALLALEAALAVIASKVGAGPHHLLPLVAVNALLGQRAGLAATSVGRIEPRLLLAAVLLPSLLALANPAFSMAKGWRKYAAATADLKALAARHPEARMGVTDVANYPFSYLRCLLPSEQVDYPAYADLALAGIGEENLGRRLEGGAIWIVPARGKPFSLLNGYTGRPLFSERLREKFAQNCRLVEQGSWWMVLRCPPERPRDSVPASATPVERGRSNFVKGYAHLPVRRHPW